MQCDICGKKYAKKMVDGIIRCEECGKKAKSMPGWNSYVKEVTDLRKCNDDYYRRWIRKGKVFYKGRKI